MDQFRGKEPRVYDDDDVDDAASDVAGDDSSSSSVAQLSIAASNVDVAAPSTTTELQPRTSALNNPF